jgi:hypothetical protein
VYNVSCVTAALRPSWIDSNRIEPQIPICLRDPGICGPASSGGAACTLCDMTNGAASACGTTALSNHKDHSGRSRAFNSNSSPPAPAASCKKAALHHHGTASPTSKVWRSDQALSGIQRSCCHASNLLSLSIQAVVTPQNRGTPVSNVLAARIVGVPVVVRAASKPEAVSPPSVVSDQAFLCVFLV